MRTVPGMLYVCKTLQQSQWTRRSNFARIGRVAQEAKSDRAIFPFMIANDNGIVVRPVSRHLVRDEVRCWKGCASQQN